VYKVPSGPAIATSAVDSGLPLLPAGAWVGIAIGIVATLACGGIARSAARRRELGAWACMRWTVFGPGPENAAASQHVIFNIVTRSPTSGGAAPKVLDRFIGRIPRALPKDWETQSQYNLATTKADFDLLHAARVGSSMSLNAALIAGARPFAREKGNGMTALHLACQAEFVPGFNGKGYHESARDKRDHTRIIRILLQASGGNPRSLADVYDARGDVPLHIAVRTGLLSRVEALLPHSDLYARNVEGDRPLQALLRHRNYGSWKNNSDHERIATLLEEKEVKLAGIIALPYINFSELQPDKCELGRGSFGVVSRFRYYGAPVAVKELVDDAAAVLNDAGQLDAFLGEAVLQKSLDHPYIVRVLGVAVERAPAEVGTTALAHSAAPAPTPAPASVVPTHAPAAVVPAHVPAPAPAPVGSVSMPGMAVDCAPAKVGSPHATEPAHAAAPAPAPVAPAHAPAPAPRYGLVMDLCEGSLAARIGVLTPSARLEAARQVAAGLDYLHSRKPPIVHGDVKPHNVLFKLGGRDVALCDFGFAAAKAGISQSQSAGGGKGHGTPGFMAPELFKTDAQTGKPLEAASLKTDVYAFGVLCFCLATGRAHPYPEVDAAGEVIDVSRRVRKGLRPADTSLWPEGRVPLLADSPPALMEIAEECWEQIADARPEMSTLSRRLENICDEWVGKAYTCHKLCKTWW
jgi:serine/threonine protein kinase